MAEKFDDFLENQMEKRNKTPKWVAKLEKMTDIFVNAS